jgi:N-acetylglutamate synthase-like GNAT family acetyltransferase
MNKIIKKNIIIRTAEEEDIKDIYNILSNAFSPYTKFYTKTAYQATVVSPNILKKRIQDNKANILVAELDNKIIGTASFYKKQDYIYLYSMAVDPVFQKNGVGNILLNKIIKFTTNEKIKKILIYSYYPLKDAIRFYESNGFKKSGKKLDYHGINVFEMIRVII